MKVSMILPILLLITSQNLVGQTKSDDSPVEVLNSKWSKSRQKIENSENRRIVPAESANAPGNRNFERNRKVNDQVGVLDPKEQTIEARSAALEKNVQEARSPKIKFLDGFVYQTKVLNRSANNIEVLFWEYQFKEKENPANLVIRQFLCGVQIKPEKEQELKVFSAFSPSRLISVDSLNDKSKNLFEEKVLINRVEYANGTIWQRKGWNYAEVKPAIARALETPWGLEMCRSL